MKIIILDIPLRTSFIESNGKVGQCFHSADYIFVLKSLASKPKVCDSCHFYPYKWTNPVLLSTIYNVDIPSSEFITDLAFICNFKNAMLKPVLFKNIHFCIFTPKMLSDRIFILKTVQLESLERHIF